MADINNVIVFFRWKQSAEKDNSPGSHEEKRRRGWQVVTCKLFGAYLSKLGFSLPVSVFVVMMPVCCVPKLKRKCEKVERDDEDKLWWQSLLYRLFRGVF